MTNAGGGGAVAAGGLVLEMVFVSIDDSVDVQVTQRSVRQRELPRARQLALRGSF